MDFYQDNQNRFEQLAKTWDENPEYLKRSKAIAAANCKYFAFKAGYGSA